MNSGSPITTHPGTVSTTPAPAVTPRLKTGLSAKDRELKRLQELEAHFNSYKQKHPLEEQALARSDTHDVGHAEGSEALDRRTSKIALSKMENTIKNKLQ
jgi:hypothetical protein